MDDMNNADIDYVCQYCDKPGTEENPVFTFSGLLCEDEYILHDGECRKVFENQESIHLLGYFRPDIASEINQVNI